MSYDPVTAVANLGEKFIDIFFESKEAKAEAKLKMFEMTQNGKLAEIAEGNKLILAQIDVNKTEAASTNWFVAGARPFVMWVCGTALAYASLIEPFARFISKVYFNYDGDFPIIDTDITLQVLMGMLGLSGFRSFEKNKGVARG